MPLILQSSYEPPVWLPNGHFQTIYPSLFRKVSGVHYERERIATPDADFLNLDWSCVDQHRGLIILSHGLEGDSQRQYMTGMVKAFNQQGYDCLAWNFRGCGGELNQQVRFYHSGATDDLALVIAHAQARGFDQISLIGFSLGGNLTLKYLGEQGAQAKEVIRKAVVFSVPLHLSSGSTKLESWQDWIYTQRFNRSLKRKIREKAIRFPDQIDTQALSNVQTLRDFDNHYTSKLHGFADAEDYYARNSAVFFVPSVEVSTLVINAQNDPFLSAECYPYDLLERHPHVWFEAPKTGGHCGFWPRHYHGMLWSERRAVQFLDA
jgi:uncharacterized protein